MSQLTPASTLEHLSRLAARPGVQSTLILSKADGSIIRTTGLLAERTANGDEETTDHTSSGASGQEAHHDKSKGAESVARMVFSFISGAQDFVEGMDSTDDVKLLRLRTRKSEVVIVPDPKFLLVVIHDAPQT